MQHWTGHRSHGLRPSGNYAFDEYREEALRRLEEGTYGYCFECGEEISEKRLRALPFAVRCKDCEEAREVKQQRDRLMAQRRGAASLFIDMQG